MTIGSVFSCKQLVKKDSFISFCYEKNKDVFDSIELDFNKICQLAELARDNMWFKYLLDSFDEDVGWIDFELEIKKVLLALKPIFENKSYWINVQTTNRVLMHMLKYFGFFTNSLGSGVYDIEHEYLIEKPMGSKNYELNVNAIINTLFDELCVLAEMLKIYLSEFIEKAVEITAGNDLNGWLTKYGAQHIISFNNTNTYEQLFPDGDVIHIHGINDKEIILGVNPDNDDEMDNFDTTFLMFKKYYQRVLLKTDIDYLQLVELLERNFEGDKEIFLTVIGHSLDETDKDIITELFKFSTNINVLYYNSDSLEKHINNLISIYGKKGFEELRYKKRLTFTPLSEEIETEKVLQETFESLVLQALEEYI